jgi:alpha-amylase
MYFLNIIKYIQGGVYMKKFFLIFTILGVLFFTISCEKNFNSSNQSKKDLQENKSKADENINYDISNSNGTFSSKDLIYFIMTDRFYDGDASNNNFSDVNKNDPNAYHGGDLKGIIEKLDYIKSLGATAIWITPVCENEYGGYHGYWTCDFYNVDPHLGTINDLKNLVTEAHKKDIKVILDHVVNHTGYKSPWLKDESKKDWFNPKLNISDWNDQNQIENGWLAGLPDLNQNNAEVKKYLIDNTLWWIKETGVDGMRLDTVKHVPKEFWKEFTSTIKEKYPNFYLLGEVWSDDPQYLEQYHKLGIDGLTNYSLYSGIRKAFTKFGKTIYLVNALKHEDEFSNPNINGIFIDNHDNTRLLSQAGEHGDSYLKQALTFIMTYPAIPIVYYGTEIGMEGNADPDNRRNMEWDRINNSEILKFYRHLIKMRNTNPALISGDFKLLDYDSCFISYKREKNEDSVIVIMNVQNKEKDIIVNIPNIPNNAQQYEDLLTNKTYNIDNEKLQLKLKPLDVIILQSQK